jgi:hypothetical protein
MTGPAYNLVHANIATARASFDDPLMKDFVERIEEIDALAQSWPGFIAQPALPDEGEIYQEPILLNVSIWDSIKKLEEFTYASRHTDLLMRRAEWFVPSDQPAYVLYWSPAGELPTEKEIKQRHEYLYQHGATPFAFTFDASFTVEELLEYSHEEKDRSRISSSD